MTDQTNGVAASLTALNTQYETIAHNLANSSTPAFKRHRVRFEQAMAQAGAGSSAGAIRGASAIDFSQGPLEQTDRPLDFAISGKGFFTLETPQGTLYTRSGTFTLNANRQLVNSSGQIVAGQNGPIVMPPNCTPSDVRVAPDGELKANSVSFGKLKIVDFARGGDLQSVGAGCFRASPEAPATPATGTVCQGYQESSNVNVVGELVDLIQLTRLYEANLKNVSATDERMRNLIQVAMS
jgi:flagellar basal-body rod protein FlgF